MIIGYCTFLITEYFIGPYKVRLEQILFERAVNIETRDFLSIKYKSIIMIMLILFSMIILTIMINRSEKPLYQIVIFIFLSITSVGLLIFLMINNLNISLDIINRSTKKLAAGGIGLFFPPFSDREFTVFSENYNRAAMEINEIRTGLERKITERTEELSAAYERLNKAYGQIQADLTLAKRIQKRLMPENFDSIEGLDLLVHYYPMADIGGDIYDIVQLYPGYVRVFLADAIGHGIQAALITMIIKGEYEKVKTIEDARELLEWLNKSFTDLYISLNAFFSCVIVDIDLPNQKMYYSSAGHPDQIHVSRGIVEKMKHTGRLVGIKRDTRFGCVERAIKPHDKILLYTDGLFEQFNDRDEGFNENDIVELVENNKDKSVHDIESELIGSLWKFVGDEKEQSISDDITLICIEIKE
ncbi:MAG: serine/threonine-protein phosphatase [Chrysiogenales bacterium]|nr:MAG: serine/threonine-protein phosphatase [Chrysiogenales bacterium]